MSDLSPIKKLASKTSLTKKIYGRLHKLIFRSDKFSSKDYWEQRYVDEGNSGAGSYGRLAKFKAKFLNDFVKKNNIKTVLEFGSGDGAQTKLFKFPQYVGLDVSPKSIQLCVDIFKDDKKKSFFAYDQDAFLDNAGVFTAELTLCLDVIYHLVEDSVFETYMHNLFNTSSKYVIIYSSDKDDQLDFQSGHVRHRKFTPWVKKNIKGWKLQEKVDNKYQLKGDDENESFADFYIYKKSK